MFEPIELLVFTVNTVSGDSPHGESQHLKSKNAPEGHFPGWDYKISCRDSLEEKKKSNIHCLPPAKLVVPITFKFNYQLTFVES